MSENLAKQIMAWAIENYDEGGHWIAETMELEEIAEEFKTLQQAKEHCRVVQDRQEDIKNS